MTKKSFKLVHVSMAPKARKPRVWKAWAVVDDVDPAVLGMGWLGRHYIYATRRGAKADCPHYPVVRVTITADAILSERGK